MAKEPSATDQEGGMDPKIRFININSHVYIHFLSPDSSR